MAPYTGVSPIFLLRRADMGCLKNFFAMIGMVVVVGAGSIAAWTYRVEIRDYYGRWKGKESAVAATPTSGRPSDEALRSARRTSAEMERADGPSTATLDADAMASLVLEGIARGAANAIDSLTLTLGEDRVSLDALVITEIFARDLLGPFSGVLDRTERIRVSGPVRVVREGVMAWTPDELKIRSFPMPGAVIGPMVNTLTGGSDGAFRIPVPTTVSDVRVRTDEITFYRRTD